MINFSQLILPFFIVLAAQYSHAVQDIKNARMKWLIKLDESNLNQTGKGYLVAVVDSGVSPLDTQLKSQTIAGWSFAQNSSDTLDREDHGTPIASIISQLAPGAKILPVAVTHENGVANREAVIKGIVYAILRGASIINLSIGITEDMLQKVLSQVGAPAFSRCLLVIASGNARQEVKPLISSWPNVIVIGATKLNQQVEIASYSNFGSGVDLTAPSGDAGDGLTSRSSTGSLRLFNGTSGAAPVVSAAAVLVKEKYRFFTGDQIKNWLLQNSCTFSNLRPYVSNGRMLNVSLLNRRAKVCP